MGETNLKTPAFLLELLISRHFLTDVVEVLLHLLAQVHVQTTDVSESREAKVEVKT